MKILHTLIGMGSAALAAAVPYSGKAARISRKGQRSTFFCFKHLQQQKTPPVLGDPPSIYRGGKKHQKQSQQRYVQRTKLSVSPWVQTATCLRKAFTSFPGSGSGSSSSMRCLSSSSCRISRLSDRCSLSPCISSLGKNGQYRCYSYDGQYHCLAMTYFVLENTSHAYA